jgi:hypothetical protein
MTIDGAKEILKRYDTNFCDSDGNPISAEDLAKAYEVAIKSLEAWDKIIAEIIVEGKKNYTNSVFNKGLYRAIEIIDKHLSEVGE